MRVLRTTGLDRAMNLAHRGASSRLLRMTLDWTVSRLNIIDGGKAFALPWENIVAMLV